MGLLQVDVASLGTLAGQCRALASEVGGVSTAPESLLSSQATAAAVEALHASVSATGGAMMARLQTTATKLNTAGAAFAAQESRAADSLAALTASTAV